MSSKCLVVCISLLLTVLSVADAADLCGLVFTTEARGALDLPETRPFLIQTPDQPISVFYDAVDSINVQIIDSGPATVFAGRNDPKATMSFSVANYKDDSAIYLAVLDASRKGVATFYSAFPFAEKGLDLRQITDMDVKLESAPTSVAAYRDYIAYAWISTNTITETFLQVTRSSNTATSFKDSTLKRTPAWHALTYVRSAVVYSTPTFLGVYQDIDGMTNFFKFAADDPAASVGEYDMDLVGSGNTMSHLSIAAYNKVEFFAITGQLISTENVLKGVYIATFRPDFTLESKVILDTVSRPSLYITEFDELFITYLTPDNTTCVEVYKDPSLSTRVMGYCTAKIPTAPGWSGITADHDYGYFAINVLRESQSVIDVYKCNFGCGNGVVSRDEQCEIGGSNCDNTCNCKSGSIPHSPPSSDCIVPQVPVTMPMAQLPPPNSPPSQTPIASPTAIVSAPRPPSTVPVVLPILDCNARLNQTHFRSYLSYETRTQGVASVTVPIGEQNRFTVIAPNQGQPTTFFSGRSKVFNTAVDIASGQSVDWILTRYRLNIAEAESNRCPSDIAFNIGITSPTPPSQTLINATIDYVAWVFNVSSNNVSVNVTQGAEQNQYDLTVTVQVTTAALISAIEGVRNITEDTTSLEEHIKDIAPEVSITEVRGNPTGVNNPAAFIAEPVASLDNNSSSYQLVAVSSVFVLVLSLVMLVL